MESKTQIQQVQEHLEAGYPITPAKAMAEYNVWRLAALIHKLRQRGLNIVTYDRKAMNGKRYAEYQLEPARETVVWESPKDLSIFGLSEGVTTGRSSGSDYTTGLQSGDVVKVVGNSAGNPCGSHVLPIPSIAIVEEVTGNQKVGCRGVMDWTGTVYQSLLAKDLEKVTDPTGLRVQVHPNPECLICAKVTGETGVIQWVRKHPARGTQYEMQYDSPLPVICQNSSDIIPQAL